MSALLVPLVSVLVAASPTTAPIGAAPDVEAEVAAAARRFLKERPRLRRADCSGLVEAVFAEVGIDRRGGTKELWRDAVRDGRVEHGAPRPGHLVFFDRTYDADGDGRADDDLTHVAVVVDVEADGTVVMVHRERAGIRRLRMNLDAPSEASRAGRRINDVLAARGYGGARAPRLAGQLYRGHARPPGAEAPALDEPRAPPPLALARPRGERCAEDGPRGSLDERRHRAIACAPRRAGNEPGPPPRRSSSSGRGG